jgi:outer membrane protein assembly factor BamA
LALGLNVDYFWARQKNGQIDSKNTTVVFGAGPFLRYYLPTTKVLPYAELNAGFGTMKDTYESDAYDNVTKSSITSLGIGVGVAAPLSDKFTFDVLIGYSSTTIKETDDNPDNERYVIGSVGIKLGFTYYFSFGAN